MKALFIPTYIYVFLVVEKAERSERRIEEIFARKQKSFGSIC